MIETRIFRTSVKEEMINVITHALGIGMSIVGLIVLIMSALEHGDIWHLVSFTIFGVSLIVMYSASTLYHSFRKVRPKYFANIVDHSVIYVLIAGSYTPYTLTALRGPWGWSIFGIIWGIAILGLFYKAFFIQRWPRLSTVLYLLMGWIVFIAAKPMYELVPRGGLYLLLAGGLSYSLGVIFYVKKNTPYAHAIWHLFVLGGSILHFLSIWLYLLPQE